MRPEATATPPQPARRASPDIAVRQRKPTGGHDTLIVVLVAGLAFFLLASGLWLIVLPVLILSRWAP